MRQFNFKYFSLVIFLFMSVDIYAKPLKTFHLHLVQSPARLYTLEVRVGVQEPDSEPIGDIFYFIGLGDRLDNHEPLFNQWVRQGFRVISFDYPSHGETHGSPLDLFTFRRLALLATQVERATLEDPKRPLILAGWSTGGLLAIRMLQSGEFPKFSRPVSGAILFAPAVSPYSIVGRPSYSYPFGEITNATLTHDPAPPHKGPARPRSPLSLSSYLFSGFLRANAWQSWRESYPKLPTLIFVTGEKSDLYINSKELKAWIAKQNEVYGAHITEVDEPGARHEIDNETPRFGGPQVRNLSGEFAQIIVSAASKGITSRP